MDSPFAQYGISAVTIALVVAGMRVLWTQYLDTRKELRANADACAEREAALVKRVQSLEDSRNSDLVSVINAAMESMRMTATALHENSGTFRIMAEESGLHRVAIKRPNQ
jgi:hypothetical protein